MSDKEAWLDRARPNRRLLRYTAETPRTRWHARQRTRPALHLICGFDAVVVPTRFFLFGFAQEGRHLERQRRRLLPPLSGWQRITALT